MHTVILGIGNTLLSDEGIGVHVVNHLKQSNLLSDQVRYVDGGTLSFTLASEIEQSEHLIVIDASELGEDPGTVRVFESDAMDQFVTSGNKKSVHEVGLADVMSICLLNQSLPEKRALIGIQPENLRWGEKPTPAVAQSIPLACKAVANLLAQWQEAKVA